MGEAYWIAGGFAGGEGITSALHQNGLQPRWIEESHVLSEPIPNDVPGLSFTWPALTASSALRWLQGQIVMLRHHEREWLLLVQAADGGLAWSVLASAAGAGRYNRLPRACLRDLSPLAEGEAFPEMWGDWLSKNGVEFDGRGHVVGLGMSQTQVLPLPAGWTYTRVPGPAMALPIVLTTWVERVTRGAVGVIVLVSAVQAGWIGVAITPV